MRACPSRRPGWSAYTAGWAASSLTPSGTARPTRFRPTRSGSSTRTVSSGADGSSPTSRSRRLREGLEDIRSGRNLRTGELYEIDEDYRRAPEAQRLPLPRRLADRRGLPRPPLASRDHGQGRAAPGRAASALLARPGLLQAGAASRGRDLAPGLFVLDALVPRRARDLLGGPRRRDPRERLRALRARQPPLGPPPEDLAHEGDGRGARSTSSRSRPPPFALSPWWSAAGECLFHHSHTVHGSYGNRSDGPRRGVVVNFMRPDTRCGDGDHPLLTGVPLIPKGAVIEGDYFPML